MEDTVSQVQHTDIPWHPPEFSHRLPARPFTYGELTQVTEVEDVISTLALDEIAGWILDLIHDRESLRIALCAAMDALNCLQQRQRRRSTT
jgi:hypothetical protein